MKRIYGALLFLFMMLAAVLPVSASSPEVMQGHGVYINPLYANLHIELPESVPDDGTAAAALPAYYSTMEAAADYLRDEMTERQKIISFEVYSKDDSFEEVVDELMEIACDEDYAAESDEGDYLRWHIYGCSYDYSVMPRSGGYDYSFRLYFIYHSTAAQERETTAKIAEVMARPEIKNASTDYETVRAVYNYVTSTVEYDERVNDPLFDMFYERRYIRTGAPSPFSAYDAVCCGIAVCQGYSSLIYRMLREAGIPVRFIGGYAYGDPSYGHAWNIVQIEGIFYNMDSTWDAGLPESEYEFFLKGDTAAQFPDHTRIEEYRTDAFYKNYPMSSTAYVLTQETASPENSITYVLDGGTNSAGNPGTFSGQEVVLQTPSRVGYTFDGWYTDSGYKNEITSIPAAPAQDYILYAKWTKVKVGDTKVTAYRANGNGFTVKYKEVPGASGYRILYTHSSDFSYETVKYLDMDASKFSAAVRVSDADERYYVKVRAFKIDSAGKKVWGKKTSKVKGYAVSYVLDDGINHAQNPHFIYKWKYTLKNPTREGYTFCGWYTDKEYKNKITYIRKANSKKLTLYARWQRNS